MPPIPPAAGASAAESTEATSSAVTTSASSAGSMSSSSARQALIREQTVVDRPYLVPEVALHLVTDRCPLWRATDADLEALALPAPYWAFAWAGGQALARYVLDEPEVVKGKAVLCFGAGGGVEAVAAALAGAARVVASDIDPFAVDALRMNARLNGVTLEVTDADLLGQPSTGGTSYLSVM